MPLSVRRQRRMGYSRATLQKIGNSRQHDGLAYRGRGSGIN